MNRRSVLPAMIAAPIGLVVTKAVFAASGDLAQRFAKTLSDHDIEAFAALFADDYVNHQVSAAAPSPPAGMRPKDATVAFFKGRLTGMPDLHVSIEAQVANGERFAASFVYEGTQTGSASRRPAKSSASHPATFFASRTAGSPSIGAWATSRA